MPETDRVALITGAGGGIGSAIARRLGADGMQLVITDYRAPDELADELHAISLACNLSDASHTRQLAAAVLSTAGRFDVLVNNVADLTTARLGEVDLTARRRVQAVNVEAPVLLCQALVPSMAERGWGRVVNIVSDTVHRPLGPGMLPYITSKAAMIGVTRALAVEWGGYGVTVNAVAPGLTSTAAARRDLADEAFAEVRSPSDSSHADARRLRRPGRVPGLGRGGRNDRPHAQRRRRARPALSGDRSHHGRRNPRPPMDHVTALGRFDSLGLGAVPILARHAHEVPAWSVRHVAIDNLRQCRR